MIARIHVLFGAAAAVAACGQVGPAGGGGGPAGGMMATTTGAAATATTTATVAAAPGPGGVVIRPEDMRAAGADAFGWGVMLGGGPLAGWMPGAPMGPPTPDRVVAPHGPRAYPLGQTGLSALPGLTLDQAGTPIDTACAERVRRQAMGMGFDQDAARLQVGLDCD